MTRAREGRLRARRCARGLFVDRAGEPEPGDGSPPPTQPVDSSGPTCVDSWGDQVIGWDASGSGGAPQHSVSVAAVIVNPEGDVLVIRRRDNGAWQPPGGILERDETIAEGLAREVLEETGLSIGVDGLTGVYKHVPEGIVAMVFRCTQLRGSADPRVTPETQDVRWMSPAEVFEHMDTVFAMRVRDALRFAPPSTPAASIRAHNGTTWLDDRAASLPAGADRPGSVESAGDAVAVGLTVTGQQGRLEVLEPVE